MLGCLWNDCLFLTPTHPRALRGALETAGHAWPARGRRFFAIPGGLPRETTVMYWYRDTAPTSDLSSPMEDVVPYDPSSLEGVADMIPDGTRRYFAEMRAAERRPLMFVGLPHVMHRGSIDVSDVPKITV